MQNLSSSSVINKHLLNEQVYNHLLELIVTDELKPGTKLSLAGLSEMLGVSRSPVAVAINALDRDGYVQVIPQYGTFVRVYSREEMDVIYQARVALERVVVPCAIQKASEEELLFFRNRFESFGKNKTLGEVQLREAFNLDIELHDYFAGFLPDVVARQYANICNLTKRSRLINLNYGIQNLTLSKAIHDNILIHVEIIDAVIDKDAKKATKLIEKDILYTKKQVLAHLYGDASQTDDTQ